MAGFEGFEKRLELNFSGDDPIVESHLGLRQLGFESLEKVLHAVQCTVVSAVANHYFDAYVLSESSLFVYPTKIIIKTCGTTQLLKSIRPLIKYADDMGLILCGCRYTRGSFIFPNSQPYPHTSFKDEVNYLENRLPSTLIYRKATVMDSFNSDHHKWHVFTASDGAHFVSDKIYTVEVCMTELDPVLVRKFFRRPGSEYVGDMDGKEMTAMTGIGEINPNAIICDFGFDPCGYSMNGVDLDRYSTIHVTPEEGFSYASFECVGTASDGPARDGLGEVLRKVARVFRPKTMSVATTGAGPEVWARVKGALEPMGLKCGGVGADDFPAVGSVVFQTFATRRD